MSMGNYLCGWSLYEDTMATTQPAVGVDHPTVVPENYDVDEESTENDVSGADADGQV